MNVRIVPPQQANAHNLSVKNKVAVCAVPHTTMRPSECEAQASAATERKRGSTKAQ